MIHYFAYGSNMDIDDFNKWCEEKKRPVVKFKNIRPAKLIGYKLTFNFYFNYYSKSRRGGAANMMVSEKDAIYGILSDINENELSVIREKENYPISYQEKSVKVEQLSDGKIVNNVITYKVVNNQETTVDLPPTREYMDLIIKNAKKYHFPQEYIHYLESIPTKD